MVTENPTELEQSNRWAAWLAQLAELGGANPLRNFEANSWAQIDLTKAHPGGLAQFVSTSGVRLTNLVRDPLAFSKATAAANRIFVKAGELRLGYGVESTYLVGGLASLQAGGFDLSLPILLWPIAITEAADDYQISKTGNPFVNPELITAFSECFDVKIDERKLLAKLETATDLVPLPVLEYLSDLGSAASSLELKRVLTIGNFVPEITLLRSAVDAAKEPVLSLFSQQGQTGEISATEQVRMADLDSNQLGIVAKSLSGQSFAVEVLPGCGYTQTVSAIVTNLALQGKKVLLVANRMQTIDEVSQRLAGFGLPGLVARSDKTWLDVVAGISRNEKSSELEISDFTQQLDSVGAELDEYESLLNSKSPTLKVSILDCLKQLASLAAMPHAPLAQARISIDHLVPRSEYQEFIDQLFEVERMGIFKYGPKQSAWYGARFESEQQIDSVLVIARRLRNETFPQLSIKLREFITASEFAPADSIAQWGTYLRLFTGLRETLDKLKPEVFDRPLDDLIEATASRKNKTSMSGKTRRRLKKLAKEFVRPGMVVSDINEALSAAKHQKELWSTYSTSLKPPAVPHGINDALVSFQAFVNDLKVLQNCLHHSESLEVLNLDSLASKLDSLCDSTEPLDNYFEKAEAVRSLKAAGLADLVDDFAMHSVKPEHLVAEFDQVWWQSALESLIAQKPRFIEFDHERIIDLEVKYRSLDASQVENQQRQVAAEFANRWSQQLKLHSGQVEVFREILKSGRATLSELLANAPDLLFAASPVLALPGLQVASQLPVETRFDCLILLDAAGSTIGENLAGLSRTSQVIAFGDEVISAANGFETEPSQSEVLLTQASAFREISEVFGCEVLRLNYRLGGQILGPFVNREFYQNRLQFEPTAADYFDKSRIKLDLIFEGSRATSNAEGANESLDAEVIKAVELVFNHAVWHPEDSLLVATASELHAERIRSSITAGLKTRPDLQTWFEAHGAEKFEVATISKLRHRIADRVIFSLGFGKSQHGAVLSNFGNLSTSDGRRALANLLVSVRKELHIVSCLAAEDLAKENLSNGAAYLKDLLNATRKPQIETFTDEPNALLEDLALRLRKLGVTVKFGFGQRLNMVASYGTKAMVLIPDWSLHGVSKSEKHRLRPNLIESMGWAYRRITSFELFSDPLMVAQRVAQELGINVKNAGQQSFEPDWANDKAVGDLRDPGESNDDRLKSERPPHWG